MHVCWQELRPRQVLQQLAAPEEGGNARVESIDVLKNLLWTTDGQAAGKSSRRQLLDAACQHLTAAEQVAYSSCTMIERWKFTACRSDALIQVIAQSVLEQCMTIEYGKDENIRFVMCVGF